MYIVELKAMGQDALALKIQMSLKNINFQAMALNVFGVDRKVLIQVAHITLSNQVNINKVIIDDKNSIMQYTPFNIMELIRNLHVTPK